MDEKQIVDITTNEDVTFVIFSAASISGVDEILAASEKVTKFIKDNYPRKIVVDFHQVKFFTSQTLGLLMDIWRRLKDYDGRVVISGINPQLHRVFRITNLDKIFEFFPDRQSALKNMTTA